MTWIVDAISPEMISQARTETAKRLLNRTFGANGIYSENDDLRFVAEALELAALDLLDAETVEELRELR